MKMLVFITNKSDTIQPILADLMEQELSGATVIDGKGMLSCLNEPGCNPPPIFGSLRQFLNPDTESVKILLMVLPEEHVASAKKVVHAHCGDLRGPNSGVMFLLDALEPEGV